MLLKVPSMFWRLDCLCRFPIIHDTLEIKSEYVSMNTAINCPERDPSWQGWARPLGNGKANVLDEQARLTEYMMTQEDEAPSLSVEDVVGP